MKNRFDLRRCMLLIMAFLLVVPLISGLVDTQPVSAASPLTLDSQQQTASITYYNVLRVCVYKHMYGDINTHASNNTDATPTRVSWFDTNTTFVIYKAPNGESKDCNNIMSEALTLWGFKSDGSDFLTKMGYQFQATGQNAPRYHGSSDGSARLAAYESLVQLTAFTSNFTGDAPLTGVTKYYGYMTALGSCKAQSIGIYSSLNSTLKSFVDSKSTDGSKTYAKVTLANSDGTTTDYGYTYDNTVNGPFVYGAASESINNTGAMTTTCVDALKTVSGTAQAAATDLATDVCKKTYSTPTEITACAAGASHRSNILYCSSTYKLTDLTACYAGQGYPGGDKCYKLYTDTGLLQSCLNGLQSGNANYCNTTYPTPSDLNSSGRVANDTNAAKRNACLAGTNFVGSASVMFNGGTTANCIANPNTAGCAPPLIKDTCAIDGIGWMICPVVNFMSQLTDGMFTFLSDNFLQTNPDTVATTGSNTGTYTAWGVIRNIANAAFVIIFLVIIFSQITNFGIGNYGVKKLLPRLVIAAILVNISFFVCQIAIDLSNLVGFGVKGLFDNIGATVINQSGKLAGDVNGTGFSGWTSLSGIVVAGVAGVVAYGALASLITILIAALIAILMIFLLLILRQMLIILLVVVAPLAFVAFLLPNTEPLFKKWRQLFTALLLLYPIIGLVFGASSLASTILGSVYKDSGNTIEQIIAAGVLIVPLFIVPVLLKAALNGAGQLGSTINNLGNKAGNSAGKKGGEVFGNSRLAQFQKYREGERNKRRGLIQSGVYEGSNRNPLNWGRNASTRINKGINAATGKFGDRSAAMGVSLAEKMEDEEVGSAETLIRAGTDPTDLIKKASVELKNAVVSGDIVKARAAQKILLGSGNKGIEALHGALQESVTNKRTDVVRNLRSDLNAAGLKGKNNVLASWAYNEGTLSDTATSEETYSKLNDVELAGQSLRILSQAKTQGHITPAQAKSIISNQNVFKDLDEDKKDLFRGIAGQEPPTARSNDQPPVSPTPPSDTGSSNNRGAQTTEPTGATNQTGIGAQSMADFERMEAEELERRRNNNI